MAEPLTNDAAAPPASPTLPALTSGAYLKLRREAAGKTIADVAFVITYPGPTRDRWSALLAQAEENKLSLDREQLEVLRQAFPFDPFIYECLRDEVPAGRICRGCGCSWNDACVGSSTTCAWSSSDPDICSHCTRPRLATENDAVWKVAREPHAAIDALIDALRRARETAGKDMPIILDDGRPLIGTALQNSKKDGYFIVLVGENRGGVR